MESLPKDCINLKSRQLSRLTTKLYEAELSKIGLKVTQFTLLSKVLRFGPVGLGALAENMAVDPSTLTRNIQPLIRKHWLAIEKGEDARNRRLTITESGRIKQAEAMQHWLIAQQQMNDLLGEQRSSSLSLLLDDCINRLAGKHDKQSEHA